MSTRLVLGSLLLMILSSTLCSHLLDADEYTHEWVGVSEQGSVSGRIIIPGPDKSGIAAPDVRVTLLTYRNHAVVAQTTTDTTGRFTFSDVPVSPYILIAQNESTFACGVLHVLDGELAAGITEIEIPAAILDPKTVDEAVLRYLRATPSRSPRNDLPEESMTFSGTPLRVAVVQGGMEARMLRNPWRGAADTNVFLFRDGTEVDRTITKRNGWFRFESVPAGRYSVLAVGRHGLAAGGIQLIDTEAERASLKRRGITDEDLVMQATSADPAFALELAPPFLFEPAEKEPAEEEPSAPPELEFIPSDPDIPYAPGVVGYWPRNRGSSGGGGGGGGGFAGGFKQLPGLVATGTIVAPQISDDDGVTPPPTPSPFVP